MMVNSLARLFAEIIESLDHIGAQVDDPFARTQVSAIMDLLTNLAPRLEWNRGDLMITIDELRALFAEIIRRLDPSEKPAPLHQLHDPLMRSIQAPFSEDLLAERESRSRLLIEVMEAISAARSQSQSKFVTEIQQLCDAFLRKQLDRDLSLIKRPLFRRMSQS
jgi:hypothetical protein